MMTPLKGTGWGPWQPLSLTRRPVAINTSQGGLKWRFKMVGGGLECVSPHSLLVRSLQKEGFGNILLKKVTAAESDLLEHFF